MCAAMIRTNRHLLPRNSEETSLQVGTINKQWRTASWDSCKKGFIFAKKKKGGEAKCSAYLSSNGWPLSSLFAKMCRLMHPSPFQMLQSEYSLKACGWFSNHASPKCELTTNHDITHWFMDYCLEALGGALWGLSSWFLVTRVSVVPTRPWSWWVTTWALLGFCLSIQREIMVPCLVPIFLVLQLDSTPKCFWKQREIVNVLTEYSSYHTVFDNIWP